MNLVSQMQREMCIMHIKVGWVETSCGRMIFRAVDDCK